MSSFVAVAGLARSGDGVLFISRSTTLKVKQSKIVPGAVCKLRDLRASSGRAASPNNNSTPAALASFGNTVTEDSSPTDTKDGGLLAYLISCAAGAAKFVGGALKPKHVHVLKSLGLVVGSLVFFLACPLYNCVAHAGVQKASGGGGGGSSFWPDN